MLRKQYIITSKASKILTLIKLLAIMFIDVRIKETVTIVINAACCVNPACNNL